MYSGVIGSEGGGRDGMDRRGKAHSLLVWGEGVMGKWGWGEGVMGKWGWGEGVMGKWRWME